MGSGGPPGGALPDSSASAVERGSSVVGAAKSSSSLGPWKQNQHEESRHLAHDVMGTPLPPECGDCRFDGGSPSSDFLTYNCHWPNTFTEAQTRDPPMTQASPLSHRAQ